MIGILTEKPSAAINFGKALGGRKGTFKGEAYTIVNSHGHIFAFAEPNEQVLPSLAEKYKSWELSNLPWNESDIRWIKKSTDPKTFNNIKEELSRCDEIVIATDMDPTGEGELLAWEILENIDLRGKKISRMYFVDEAAKNIQKAFVERKPISSKSSDMDFIKADYRSKWDFLSMQFTRIATKCGDGQSVLRQGRLKSAMISIVGDGLKAVKEYKKVPFYKNKFIDENGNTYNSPEEPMFPAKSEVPDKYESSSVIIDSAENKRTAPPPLLDLAALSSMLSSKGVKAKTVLDVYQKMYEDQIVSYPRTEDKKITPEQFEELLPLIDKIADVVGVDKSLLTHRTPRSTHVAVGGSHGANRPGINVPDSLEDLKKYGACASLIYTLLARNYLASLAEDYEYIKQKGHIEKYPQFAGSTNIPQKQGFKAIFFDSDDEDKTATNKELGKSAEPFVFEGFPQKPPTPTMKWLTKQLEKHNVGTGATRTSVYAEVTNEKCEYPLLVDTKGKLSMTLYGEMSYGLLHGTHIGDLKTTENLINDMKEISQGRLDPKIRLIEFKQMIIEDMETMRKNGESMRKSLGIKEKEEKEKYRGQWCGKEITFNKVWNGYTFSDEECEKLCNGEAIEIKGLISKKTGKTYGIKGKLGICEYKGKKYIGIQNLGFLDNDDFDSDRVTGVWKGKKISFKRSWGGHTFTDDEISRLLNDETISVCGLVSKDGKTYGVTGKLSNQTYNGNKFVGFKKIGFLND